MKESFEDTLHDITFNQLNITRNMARQILQSLESGNIDEDLAFSLLSQVREQIINVYNLNIEHTIAMNKPYEKIEENKMNEINSLDEAINKYTNKKSKFEELSAEKKETPESLFR